MTNKVNLKSIFAQLRMHLQIHNDLNYIHCGVFNENAIETLYM